MDMSNIRFAHKSEKSKTGSYMQSSALLSKIKTKDKRKVSIFPLTRFMMSKDNKSKVNTVSKELHEFRVRQLEKKPQNIQNALHELDKGSDEYTLDRNKTLYSYLVYSLKKRKQVTIKTMSDTLEDDKNKINSIISDATLEKIEQADTELIIKQLILGIDKTNQMSNMFSFLDHLKEKGSINNKAYKFFKKQLVYKIQQKLIPKITNPEEAKEINSLLEKITKEKLVDSGNIKKLQQAYKKQFAINFRKLVDSLADIPKKDESGKGLDVSTTEIALNDYKKNLKKLAGYMTVIRSQKLDISKKRSQKIYDYVTFYFAAHFNSISLLDPDKKKTEKRDEIFNEIAWSLIQNISAERAKNESIPLKKSDKTARVMPEILKAQELEEQALSTMRMSRPAFPPSKSAT